MEVHQPLDFSNNAAMATLLSRHSQPSEAMDHDSKAMSVLDLCVRRSERGSPVLCPQSPLSPQSPHSPHSPGSPYALHPYGSNNNNNKSSVNHNDVDAYQHQQFLLRARMKVEESREEAHDGDPRLACFPGQPPSPHSPVLSVLQQQLLPRSPSGSAFGPAPRRRRTSSGLPDSPPGSSADDRSSSAASPELLVGATTPPRDSTGMAASLDLLVGPAVFPSSVSGAAGVPIPQQVMAAGSGRTGKPTRPFKAYPKDPLSLTAGVPGVSPESALGRASNEAYAEFRRRMLAQVQAATTSVNKSQKRAASPTQSQQPADSCAPPSPTHQHGHHQDAVSSSPESSGSCGQGGTPGKDGKDAAYWERRRKNNEAAKRSRDARRAKEDEIAIRAAFLEQENLKLKYEVAALRSETAKLRCLLYSGAN